MEYELESIYSETEDFPIGIFSQTTYMPNPHHHIEFELFYLENGEAICGIDNYEFTLQPGNVIFITPGTTHYIKKTGKSTNFHYYSLAFDSSVLGKPGDRIRNVFDSISISRVLKLPSGILEQLESAARAEKKKLFGHEVMTKTILFTIITYIIQSKQYIEITDKVSPTKKQSISAIDVSLKYIRDHYKEPITMDDLLQITNYSKSHFIRLFKKHTGMNLTDYINKYRIEKSCLELIYSSKNITEIATGNGFNTVQYFSKIFKSYMNCTPKKYQKEGKNIIIPSSMATIL